MKSKQRIYMDFKRAREAADRLDSVASDLSRTADSDLQSTMDTLSSGWKCTASDTFRGKEEQLGTNIRQTAQTPDALADTIRSDAQRLHGAEMRAYELASREH